MEEATMVETGHPRRWWVLGVMCVSLILVVAGVSSLSLAIWVAAGVLVAAAGIVSYFHPDRDSVETGTAFHETEPTSEVT